MTMGFLALGTATVGFAAALEERLGGEGSAEGSAGGSAGLGPALIGASGVAMVVAGLFRRDRMSNHPEPGHAPGQSGINDVHDAASVVGALTSSVGLFALAAYLVAVARPSTRPDAYKRLRQALGRVILLGLEVLIVGDIVRTIVVDPTIESVAVLGMIVVIRIVLSFSLEVEIDGAWPWQQSQIGSRAEPERMKRP